ncbi:hypothetical protein [Chitinivibrio alkaliphilus]|uniref:DUF5723 domain-containing protein n=1 Tax=Chitinivibrio alkaliphilus ACht1 TaxID=1313304 RepID=U7DC97_9BACT|nr:hypothetical protein [Chitinivibrio alkaliphilus]ERP32045.1 hypothetical protein CALK_1027 [Chitinivibrio alkaliphilus ACht1]
MKMNVLTALCVLLGIVSAVGQNARMASLGTWSQQDASDLLYTPALMTRYNDMIQVTANTNNDHTFFVAKQMNSAFYLGMSIEAQDIVRGRFYSRADDYITFLEIGIDPFDMPQFFAALDLGAFSLGVKTLYEFDLYRATSEDDDGDTDTERELVSTKGVHLSALLGGENTTRLKPTFTIGQLRASSYEESEALDSEFEERTDFGLLLSTGLEARIPTAAAELVLAGAWTLEKYEFEEEVDGTSSSLSDNTYSDIFWDFRAGLVGEMLDNLQWVAEYRGAIDVNKTVTDPSGSSDVTTRTRNTAHTAALSFEKAVEGIWRFEHLTPRSGFAYTLRPGGWSRRNDDEVRTSWINSDGVNLTTGVGMGLGRTALDVDVNFGNWDGVLTGPTGAAATLTVDFGSGFEAATSSAGEERE